MADKATDELTNAQPGDGAAPVEQQNFMDVLDGEPLETAEEEVVEETQEEVIEDEVIESEEEEIEVEDTEAEEETEEESSEEEEEIETTDESPEQTLEDANEKLRDQIIAMAEQGFNVQSPDDVEETTLEEDTEEIKDTEPIKLDELKIEDFLTEDEVDRVNDHPELLNAAFLRAMTSFKEYVDATLKGNLSPLQQEVRALPKQVSTAVGEQMNFQTFVNDYYKDNSDLTKASKVVYMTYRNLLTEAQKAGEKTTIGELYSKAGDEVRVMLSIPKTAAKTGVRKPALKGAKTRKITQKVPSSDPTQQQFMERLKT